MREPCPIGVSNPRLQAKGKVGEVASCDDTALAAMRVTISEPVSLGRPHQHLHSGAVGCSTFGDLAGSSTPATVYNAKRRYGCRPSQKAREADRGSWRFGIRLLELFMLMPQISNFLQ